MIAEIRAEIRNGGTTGGTSGGGTPPSDTTTSPPPTDTTTAPPPADTTTSPPPADTTQSPPATDTTSSPPPADTATGTPAPDSGSGTPPADTTAGPAPSDSTGTTSPTESTAGTTDVPVEVAVDDWFVVDGSTAAYDGRAGFDTIDFSRSSQGVTVDLDAQTYSGQFNGTVANVERVIGTGFDDTLTGDGQANTLEGGAGRDYLRGKGGADTLVGGAGQDTFIFTQADVRAGGVDVVKDFSSNDTLDMSDWFGGAEPDAATVDQTIKFTAMNGGTMVSALVDGAYVNVAFLEGVAPGVPSAWASDSMLMVA